MSWFKGKGWYYLTEGGGFGQWHGPFASKKGALEASAKVEGKKDLKHARFLKREGEG